MTVAIVGGGIVGAAAAYYLRQRGEDVVVCERSNLGAGSTERAVGGIRAQFSSRVNVRLSRAALEVWDDFEETFGVDIEHRRIGYLFLAREADTAAQLEDDVAMQREEGVDAELLDPEEAATLSDVYPEQFRRAAYCPTDGVADPHLGLQGFATAAREAGAEVRTGVDVTDVRFEDGRVAGVDTDEGPIDADYVVNAAGPWAREVGAMAGLDLPVSPQRRQVIVVDPERPVPEDSPLTFDVDTGLYYLPDREGDALAGGHFGDPDERDPDGYPTDFDLPWATEVLERAADASRYFGLDAGIKRGWSGLYAVTPDHHPVIEESRPGFVNAVGFSGHGFMHAPATGQVVAELVADGEASTVDVSPLGTDRFVDAETHSERNVL
jgi:sarcosine oxidase subunit beta